MKMKVNLKKAEEALFYYERNSVNHTLIPLTHESTGSPGPG